MKCNKIIICVLICATLLLGGACSINDIISSALSDALAGGGGDANPFLSENDPELVRDSIPFTLKLLDILISSNIDSPGIRLVAAQAHTAYAALFLQSDASTIARNNFEHRSRLLDRAKIHYIRGRDYALSALDTLHPNFSDALNDDDYETAFMHITKEDVPYLYFAAVSWIGAAALNVFDLELVFTASRAEEMMKHAFMLDPEYGDGSLHEFYILYFASLPKGLGGDKQKAMFHYQQAVEISDNLSASAHVSMALGIALPAQDIAQFRYFLNSALAIDPNKNLNRRLTNIIKQREAEWYLANENEFFIDIE